MANSFKTSSGNKSFGAFSEPNDAGDYISRKKARASFCVANNCVPAVKVGTQSNLLLFNKSNKLSLYPCKNSINKANLNINLITQLDLSGASIIKDFTTSMYSANINGINPKILPYLTYSVDPEGDLFANTRRDVNNFVNYMVYSPPITKQNIQIETPYVINNGIFTISSTTNYNTLITFNYTNNANSSIKFNKNLIVNYTIVGGGGGGTYGLYTGGGGGGGGGINDGSMNIIANSLYGIIVGNGGLGASATFKNGNNGGASSIVSNNVNIIANGGQGGYIARNPNVQNGYLNGGASGNGGAGGLGRPDFGTTAGGDGINGGGGGGGQAYQAIGGGSYSGPGGVGGTGGTNNINNSYGGGGGGGGGYYVAGGAGGGNGSGGSGGAMYLNGSDAAPNKGGGGGGGGAVFAKGGNGGSGVIILAFNV
jgi:hypothetical protein